VEHTFWFCSETELQAWCQEDPYLARHPILLSRVRRSARVLLNATD
jgi:hypothetical protein